MISFCESAQIASEFRFSRPLKDLVLNVKIVKMRRDHHQSKFQICKSSDRKLQVLLSARRPLNFPVYVCGPWRHGARARSEGSTSRVYASLAPRVTLSTCLHQVLAYVTVFSNLPSPLKVQIQEGKYVSVNCTDLSIVVAE